MYVNPAYIRGVIEPWLATPTVFVGYETLPEWYQDNEYIQKYYRPVSHSHLVNLKSVLELHNETFNIWSHLVLVLPMLITALVYLKRGLCDLCCTWKSHKNRNIAINLRKFPCQNFMMFYFYLSILCMSFGSSSFHTQQPHSESIFNLFAKIDYSGVILMINGALVTWVYFTFYNYDFYRYLYSVLHSMIAFIIIYFLASPTYNKPEFRTLRGSLFVGFGLLCSIPCLHMVCRNGIRYCFKKLYLGHLILVGSLTIFGAFLYVKRYPEIFFPGKFDLLGNSHNFLHFLVLISAMILVYSMENLKNWCNKNNKILFGKLR